MEAKLLRGGCYLGGHPSAPSLPVKWTVYFHPVGAWACRPAWPDGSCQLTAADSWPWPPLAAWVTRTVGTVRAGSQLTLPSRASLCDPQTPPLAVLSLLRCLEAAASAWGMSQESGEGVKKGSEEKSHHSLGVRVGYALEDVVAGVPCGADGQGQLLLVLLQYGLEGKCRR